MSKKSTMTLNLSESEMAVLESLAKEKELAKTVVVRQAIRLYELVNAKFAEGGKLFFEDQDKDKAELLVL